MGREGVELVFEIFHMAFFPFAECSLAIDTGKSQHSSPSKRETWLTRVLECKEDLRCSVLSFPPALSGCEDFLLFTAASVAILVILVFAVAGDAVRALSVRQGDY